jgi:hypothetical protein
MNGSGYAGLPQGVIEQGAEFLGWARSVDHLTVYEHGWCAVDAK